ncbi:nucleotidyltransferase family protein [Rubrivivax gelatinosus]|uniref:nucleotidyltransferase family protein n=1 Tax=Rubrivivax gelatinosus TaxID=28068 RepID=UPI0031F942DB
MAAALGPQARVRLFGSRIDDSRRGGDIDLLVEVPAPLPDRLRRELELGARLELLLGGRRIDLLLLDPATPRQPVHEAALAQGLAL